jgi:hypothetical protein
MNGDAFLAADATTDGEPTSHNTCGTKVINSSKTKEI